MEKYIEFIVLIHAGFGGVALIAGTMALISNKGSSLHKKSGRMFYYSILTSVILSLFIAVLPGHESAFLFSIGIFSSYFILIGRRALSYRNENTTLTWDKFLMIAMVITGILMIISPVLFHNNLNIVLTIFGSAGIILALMDWSIIRDATRRKKNWLLIHATRITGGYIAAMTAFLVVVEALPGIWNWLIPGIVGSIYILYWVKKLKLN